MNCEEAKARWHTRLDEGRGDAKLDEHLGECPACREYADQMNRIVGMLDELRGETEAVASGASAPGLNESLERPRRRSLWFGPRGARIAAAVAVLVSGGALYYSMQRVTMEPVGSNDATVQAPPGKPGGAVGTKPDPRIGISLRGEAAEHYLAVAQPTSEPNVQMYWLYPTSLSKPRRDRS